MCEELAGDSCGGNHHLVLVPAILPFVMALSFGQLSRSLKHALNLRLQSH